MATDIVGGGTVFPEILSIRTSTCNVRSNVFFIASAVKVLYGLSGYILARISKSILASDFKFAGAVVVVGIDGLNSKMVL